MKAAVIDYTNWRGERKLRRVLPLRIEWGANQWHDPQWLLVGHDLDRDEECIFAMKNIHSWHTADAAETLK